MVHRILGRPDVPSTILVMRIHLLLKDICRALQGILLTFRDHFDRSLFDPPGFRDLRIAIMDHGHKLGVRILGF
jgi:hypothetical protein